MPTDVAFELRYGPVPEGADPPPPTRSLWWDIHPEWVHAWITTDRVLHLRGRTTPPTSLPLTGLTGATVRSRVTTWHLRPPVLELSWGSRRERIPLAVGVDGRGVGLDLDRTAELVAAIRRHAGLPDDGGGIQALPPGGRPLPEGDGGVMWEWRYPDPDRIRLRAAWVAAAGVVISLAGGALGGAVLVDGAGPVTLVALPLAFVAVLAWARAWYLIHGLALVHRLWVTCDGTLHAGNRWRSRAVHLVGAREIAIRTSPDPWHRSPDQQHLTVVPADGGPPLVTRVDGGAGPPSLATGHTHALVAALLAQAGHDAAPHPLPDRGRFIHDASCGWHRSVQSVDG